MTLPLVRASEVLYNPYVGHLLAFDGNCYYVFDGSMEPSEFEGYVRPNCYVCPEFPVSGSACAFDLGFMRPFLDSHEAALRVLAAPLTSLVTRILSPLYDEEAHACWEEKFLVERAAWHTVAQRERLLSLWASVADMPVGVQAIFLAFMGLPALGRTRRGGFRFHPSASQQDAVLALRQRLEFVYGPPGTGKTEFIKEVLLGVVPEDGKVLLTAVNNRAVDEICVSLAQIHRLLGGLLVLGHPDNAGEVARQYTLQVQVEHEPSVVFMRDMLRLVSMYPADMVSVLAPFMAVLDALPGPLILEYLLDDIHDLCRSLRKMANTSWR